MCFRVVLNFILIPKIGALGAAVATLAAYFVVLVARLIDTPRLISFRLCLPRLCVSLALLLAAAAVMTMDLWGRVWWTLILVVLVVAINMPALWKNVRKLLQKRERKTL